MPTVCGSRWGKVYAVDTNPSFLEFIANTAEERGLNNLETILVSEGDLALPEESLDLVFMRNVCHHLTNRVEYFRRLKKFLKPEGRVAIIEYRHAKPFAFRWMFKHHVPRETIVEEMEKPGTELSRILTSCQSSLSRFPL